MSRETFEASIEKKRAVKHAEANGEVADSHAVRLAIMRRVHLGEITLVQAQSELKRIQATAHAAGMKTRAEVFNHG
jgi:hypothetical protein